MSLNSDPRKRHIKFEKNISHVYKHYSPYIFQKMESKIDDINQYLHNIGVPKQSRLHLIVDIISQTTPITIIKEEDSNHIRKLIHDLCLISENDDMLQSLFMLFGEKVLKKSLDQYYTPLTIGRFIGKCIDDNNIKILEPACGTGDLVVSIKRAHLTCRDISQEACDLCTLNFTLHKNKHFVIENFNSLALTNSTNDFDLVITNPPFGTKTVETNQSILSSFNLGKGKKKEQLGKLFIEHGLKSLKPNGLLFIIIPNGYLSNANDIQLRRYILEKYKLIGIIQLPQNTFKRSGTGVDTSIIIIQNKVYDEDYPIFIETINDITNDFDNIIASLLTFAYDNGIEYFKHSDNKKPYNQVYKNQLVQNNFCFKIQQFNKQYLDLINNIKNKPYFTLQNINVEKPTKINIDKSKQYLYLDISEVNKGLYHSTNWILGKALPGRATYAVTEDTIILSKLKGKPSFAIINEDYEDIIVTNGMFILNIQLEKERLSLFRFLHTEEFVLQFNSLAGGSIMADVKEKDLHEKLYIPYYNDEELKDTELLIKNIKEIHILQKRMRNLDLV